VRAYADSSFILRLVAAEAGSAEAAAEYRRLDLPALFFLPLHALEVRNAILQRAFHQHSSAPKAERITIARERDVALSRLDRFISRQALIEVAVDLEKALQRASVLSRTHTERIGARAIDLLHVACAILLRTELFLTTDMRQAQLAKAEGLRVSPAN